MEGPFSSVGDFLFFFRPSTLKYQKKKKKTLQNPDDFLQKNCEKF